MSTFLFRSENDLLKKLVEQLTKQQKAAEAKEKLLQVRYDKIPICFIILHNLCNFEVGNFLQFLQLRL